MEVLKMARRASQMRDNPEGGELDPAEDVHRLCKNNFPSVFILCIDKMTQKGCDRGRKSGQFTAAVLLRVADYA